MHRTQRLLTFTGILFMLIGRPLGAADQPVSQEGKLREALRNSMLQMRDVQAQLATLQGTHTELEEKHKATEAGLAKLKSTTDAERLETEKTITGLKALIPPKDEEISKLKNELEALKVTIKDAIEQKERLLASTEENRKTFQEKAMLLDRRVTEQQAKNATMYRIGVEILDRYEKFGLGDALSAREPFIGKTRVKFQNLVQEFQDKLTEQRIKPAAPASREPSPPAAAQNERKAKATETASKQEVKEGRKGFRPRD